MRGFMDGEPSDLNPADIIAIVLMFISLGIGLASADRGNSSLAILAAIVSIPAGVLKVMSTRVKARRWRRAHGEDPQS